MIFIDFSTFCKTIGKIKVNIKSNSGFVVRMMKAIEHPHFLNCEDDDDYAGRLYSGKRPFTQALKDQIITPFKLTKAYSFFKRYLDKNRCNHIYTSFLPSIFHKEDFEVLCLALALSLEAICTKDTSDFGDFENYYKTALECPTLVESRDIQPNDIDYIMELDLKCPICGEPLIHEYKGVHYSDFRITEIYPSDLPREKKAEFNRFSVEPPNKSSKDNKIAICKRHYDIYHSIFDVEDFKKLLDQKNKSKIYNKIKKATIDSDLKEKIENTLKNLLEYQKNGKLSELSMQALHISNKIPESDTMTYTLVKEMVTKYYPTIDSYLRRHEAKFEDGSTIFGQKIKALSDYFSAELHYPPGRVIRELVQTLDAILPDYLKDEVSCWIIICYFVQHCEVLSNEVS